MKRNRFHLNRLNTGISAEAAMNINSSLADWNQPSGQSDDDEIYGRPSDVSCLLCLQLKKLLKVH